MTSVETYTPGKLAELPDGVMPWEVQGGDTLDELRQDEIPTPRLRIVGKEAVFENADTSEKYESLNVIMLGLVRQRIMWGKEVAEGEVPLCRSRDSKVGLPNVDPSVPVKKQFPWSKSNFERAKLPLLPGSEDQPVAPCESCIFKEWNDEDDEPGPCAEQLVIPVFYEDKGGNWAPAILTFQRSGFRRTTKYLGVFKAAKQAPFQYVTTITLESRSNGDVDYAVPKFAKGEPSDPGELDQHGRPTNYMAYFETFEQIKDYLRRTPVRRDDDENPNHEASTNVPSGGDDNIVDGDVVDNPADDVPPPSDADAPAADADAGGGDDDDLVF